jgi:hypothetical protein
MSLNNRFLNNGIGLYPTLLIKSRIYIGSNIRILSNCYVYVDNNCENNNFYEFTFYLFKRGLPNTKKF